MPSGSHARGDAYIASDVDLLVDFEPTARIGIFDLRITGSILGGL